MLMKLQSGRQKLSSSKKMNENDLNDLET
jgi:hypothetical protein